MKTTLRKLTAAGPLVMFLLLPPLMRAETGVQAWVQRYSGTGNDDAAIAIAVDDSNNVIVTGQSYGSGSAVYYATIKYSSAGVPLWTNLYNGPVNGENRPTAVAVDGSNSVIVTGWAFSSGGYQRDYATIKYSGDGMPLWTNLYNGPGNSDDYATALAVDGSNNVIVTGYSTSSAGDMDYATIEYSSDGVPLWTNRYNGPGNSHDIAWAVALDGSNNIVVTGFSMGSGSGYDYATIKYSSAGTPLWTNRYNGPGNSWDQAYAVAVDGSNNVIVTGYSDGSGGSYDYATIKYASDGMPLWTNLYNGPGGSDSARAVAVDSSNNVFVTGTSVGSGSGDDYATIKYSSAGVPLWTNRYNGPGNSDDEAYALAVDHNGNVIVTGYSTDSGGSARFATVKYICVPQPVLTGLRLTNGTFQMQVEDVLQPGTLVIEACTNLSTNWSPVFTNTTPTNVLFYTDPNASNNAGRFYRAFQFP